MNLTNCVLFALALNSTPAQVAETVDAIHRQFGIQNTGVVQPTDLAAAATQPTIPAGAPVTTAPPVAALLDDTGMPWDERIHSGNKAKVANGTWRKRKGVDEALFNKVSAELRGTMAAPVTAAATALAAPAAAAPPVLAAPGTLPPIPGAPAPEAPNPYSLFVQFVADNPIITPEWLQQSLAAYGVEGGSLQNLAHRADLIPDIHAAVKKAIGQ